MKVVALETSGTRGSVALLDGARLLAEHRLPADERSARSLLPCLKAMLDEHGWRPTDVEMVGVTTGPGSFTGIRVGVALAQAMGFTLGIPVVAIKKTRVPNASTTVASSVNLVLYYCSKAGKIISLKNV